MSTLYPSALFGHILRRSLLFSLPVLLFIAGCGASDELSDIEEEEITAEAISPLSYISVRLRHASTGKCIYGNATENGLIHNWGCWNDPNMVYNVYKIESANPTYFLVHKNTNKYINGSSVDGAAITNRSGYNPYYPVYYKLDDAGGGKFRLRNNNSGKCLYGTNTDGGTVHSWTCWNDPNMSFFLDPA